ncbi:hypothetical protein NKI48_02990 [Mesorhizobium sp. M0644]|uniref:hypothetical protein n=1 Tax=Mesorhizobium sp. M0644 TaxID=2956979 RepID=UPI00333B66BC
MNEDYISMAKCKVDGCDKPRHGRGWCKAHYTRWERHGDPLSGRTPKGEPERYLREVVLTYEGDECLPWPYGKSDDGYGRLTVEGRQRLVSRLVCEHKHGPTPTPEHEAAHSCGRGSEACCTKQHLSWKTRIENEADKLIHGTMIRGERHGLAKLTEPEVRQIIALKGKMLQREIAEQFGIGQPHVSTIHRKSAWTWLGDEAQS